MARQRATRKTRSPGNGPDRERVGRIDLMFKPREALAHVFDPIWKDVSTLSVAERSIFCTCDETATVERLVLDDGGRAGGHENFSLGEFFDLPDGADGEMDIEGLAVSDGYLWICGSHSLKREDPDEDDLREMQEIKWDPNRGFLGRVPLAARGDGVFDLVDREGRRTAAMVPMKASPKGRVRKMLSKDPMIGGFVGLPCKENGLDIEGLAVRGDTVLLGLRGPVVGGLALIVRMEMKLTKSGSLKPRKLDAGRRYALQAIDLRGQAVRDLDWRGDRLMVLSGATTDLEALQSVYVIDDYDPERPLYAGETLRRTLDLPAIRGSDHAEGLSFLALDGEERMVIAFDSPRDERIDPEAQRLAVDVFAV